MRFLLLLICSLLGGLTASGNSYSTTFSATENPISEGGVWVGGFTTGNLWADCRTTNGFAWGLDNKGSYADPTAILTGTWGSNQTVTATAKIGAGPGLYEEIELRLRSVITSNWNRGYEVYWSTCPTNVYMHIALWYGPHGDVGVGWTNIVAINPPTAPVNGDVLSATITNNVISAYRNGTLVVSTTDNTWSNGNPGFGFYGSSTALVGWDDFTATDHLGAALTNTMTVNRLTVGTLITR